MAFEGIVSNMQAYIPSKNNQYQALYTNKFYYRTQALYHSHLFSFTSDRHYAKMTSPWKSLSKIIDNEKQEGNNHGKINYPLYLIPQKSKI